MAPTLPAELVTQVIRELFTNADPPLFEARSLEPVQTFKRLRLVARHMKADAHQAWPGGLAFLANKAAFTAKKLLLSGVTEAAFKQGLDERRGVLEETRSLQLYLWRWETSQLLRVACVQPWFYLAKQFLPMTRALQHLDLHINNAARLALRELPLSHLRIKELRLHEISRESLVGLDLSKIDTLQLLEAAIGDSEEGAADLSGFRLPPRASTIKLKWMELSSDQVEALGLPSIAALRHLDLTGSRLTRPLSNMPALRELRLWHTHIDSHFLGSLASWSVLKQLDIRWTPVTDVTALALASNTSIERLDASGTGITHPAAFALNVNTAIQELHVGGSRLTSLAFGLPSNKTLKELSLSSCRFTAPLMQQLVDELAGNSALARLDLRYCDLTDELMIHFKLEKSSGVKELDLQGNKFTDKGLQPLVDSITEHGLLCTLDLSRCKEATESFAALFRTGSRRVIRGGV